MCVYDMKVYMIDNVTEWKYMTKKYTQQPSLHSD